MTDVTIDHFTRAIEDISVHGDNDTLPFDIDNGFIADNHDALARMALSFSRDLQQAGKDKARSIVEGLPVFSERLLVATGSAGFRITTKIHPFWNMYFNALGVAIAEALEPQRSPRAHSYRFVKQGPSLFDREASWRTFREATLKDCQKQPNAMVVQTDISSFYEHVSHHRIENLIDDLFPDSSTVSVQADRFLSKFASGRSFGLPVGGQCSRILAELLMSSIDRNLADEKITWRRFVDDFVLITQNQAEAYRALSILSHALADYGLTLNRTKTVVLSAKHYADYVQAQLGTSEENANKLYEIDLHFDPYSDTADSDYNELKSVVESLNVGALLDSELKKGQPDAFLVTQIGRTLKLHDPKPALQLCSTFLSANNLHAFRGSWSTVMRGVAAVCADDRFSVIHGPLDSLLDAIPVHSPHLLMAEVSRLHYLKTIRFRRTQARAEFVRSLHTNTSSQTVRRGCLECWRSWRDRPSFIRERNRWDSLRSEEQRMLWYVASELGDEGNKFRKQVRRSLVSGWSLGIEKENSPTFASIYCDWKPK